jgi:hypothetical protein
MERTFTTKTIELHVKGRIWAGSLCEHVYTLTNGIIPTTLSEAKKIAGDFEFLSKATLVTTTQEVKEKIQHTELPEEEDSEH